MSSDSISTKLVETLLDHAACGSKEEAIVIVDVILEEIQQQRDLHRGSPEFLEFLTGSLLENLDLSDRQEAISLGAQINDLIGGSQAKEQEVLSVGSNQEPEYSTYSGLDEDDEDDEQAPLVEGECELCDRYIQLTKHHLIPKSTWPRMEAKLMHAAEAMEGGNLDKASMILGPGLLHLLNDLQPDKPCIRQILHRTCNVCRPCHSALHKAHDNMDLALCYSTIDLILEDKQMANFCKWASKQRSGKYSLHHNMRHR